MSSPTDPHPDHAGLQAGPGAGTPLDGRAAALLAETFKALSDPTRLRLVALLSSAELRVCDLAAALGMNSSAVSHQLRTLRDLRLVRWRRAGREIYYALDDEHVAELFRLGLEHIRHGRAHR